MNTTNKIKFSFFWDKLNYPTFTTIRSIKYVKQNNLKTGQIVEIYVKNKFLFFAKITNIEIKQIKDIPLDVLKKDVAPSINTKKSIIYLKKINYKSKAKKLEVLMCAI